MTREGTINFSVSTPFNSAGLICFLFFIYYLNLLTTLFPLCVYVEKAFGRTELSELFYMLMIMEVCVCIARAEAADIYGNRRITFQVKN